MSLYLMGRVFVTPMASPADKLVLLALAEHAWDDGGEAYPSLRRLGLYTALSERTVRYALRRLEADGWLSVQRPADPDGHAPTVYQLATERLSTPGAGRAPAPGQRCPSPGQGVPQPPASGAPALGQDVPPNRPSEPSLNRQEDSPPTFRVAREILEALDGAVTFRGDPRLRSPLYWQAQVQAFPAVDFPQEIKEAQAWCVRSPDRAPRSNFPRFLGNWFRRAAADQREASG